MRMHGEGASFNAAQRADELLGQGDETRFAIWVKIVHAKEQLERQTARAGEAVH